MTTPSHPAADTGLPDEYPTFEAVFIGDAFDADWQRRFLVATRLIAGEEASA